MPSTHTHTHQLQVSPWRWAVLASGVQGFYRGVLHGDKMGEKDVENYWFGLKVILVWQKRCRKPQTSPIRQGLGDSCPSHPSCGASREIEAWALSYGWLPHWTSRHTAAPAPADEDHTVVMVCKICYIWNGYRKSLDAAFHPPKILSILEAAAVLQSLSFQRAGRVHTEWPVHGQQAWALSPLTLVFKFLKLK